MKGQYIIAYDLGTGGNKASLYNIDGRCLAENFVSYPTQYPATGWHEQRPNDWWNAVRYSYTFFSSTVFGYILGNQENNYYQDTVPGGVDSKNG